MAGPNPILRSYIQDRKNWNLSEQSSCFKRRCISLQIHLENTRRQQQNRCHPPHEIHSFLNTNGFTLKCCWSEKSPWDASPHFQVNTLSGNLASNVPWTSPGQKDTQLLNGMSRFECGTFGQVVPLFTDSPTQEFLHSKFIVQLKHTALIQCDIFCPQKTEISLHTESTILSL